MVWREGPETWRMLQGGRADRAEAARAGKGDQSELMSSTIAQAMEEVDRREFATERKVSRGAEVIIILFSRHGLCENEMISLGHDEHHPLADSSSRRHPPGAFRPHWRSSLQPTRSPLRGRQIPTSEGDF